MDENKVAWIVSLCATAMQGADPRVIILKSAPRGAGFPSGVLLAEGRDHQGKLVKVKQYMANEVMAWLFDNELVRLDAEGRVVPDETGKEQGT